jgi:hypothetical protein
MATNPIKDSKQVSGDFARQAESEQPGLLRETIDWLKYNKKWWLLPIMLMLLLVGALIVVGGTAVAPLIYTLF